MVVMNLHMTPSSFGEQPPYDKIISFPNKTELIFLIASGMTQKYWCMQSFASSEHSQFERVLYNKHVNYATLVMSSWKLGDDSLNLFS